MNIKSSHKFNRSGDTVIGCIEGINLEQYQFGVVGGRQIFNMQANEGISLYTPNYSGQVLSGTIIFSWGYGITQQTLSFCLYNTYTGRSQSAALIAGITSKLISE